MRQLRPQLPELAHHFGLHREHLIAMPRDDLNEYLSRLRELPPVGGVVLYTTEE